MSDSHSYSREKRRVDKYLVRFFVYSVKGTELNVKQFSNFSHSVFRNVVPMSKEK